MTVYQHILDYVNEQPLLLKVVWMVSIIIIIAIVFLSIYLKIIRSYLRNRSSEKAKFRQKYEDILVRYLYSSFDNQNTTTEQEVLAEILQNSIKNSTKRHIIISILYDLMNEVSGEMSISIKKLYFKTGLINFPMAKLKDKNWYVIAKGIGELTRFNIVEVESIITQFINHPSTEVRNATQLYNVNLFRFKGLSFLNDLQAPLSEWVQIQLLETLQKFDDQQICDVQPWLKSTNDSVVSFALKLTKIYNQFEAKDTLIQLLSHKSKDIRVTTIEVLTHIYGIEAKEMLKANFNELSLAEQISFFELLEKLVVPSDEPFVEKHLFHKNFEIQLLALKILKSINLDKYMGISTSKNTKTNSEILEYVNKI
jgi:hypothetical protein